MAMDVKSGFSVQRDDYQARLSEVQKWVDVRQSERATPDAFTTAANATLSKLLDGPDGQSIDVGERIADLSNVIDTLESGAKACPNSNTHKPDAENA